MALQNCTTSPQTKQFIVLSTGELWPVLPDADPDFVRRVKEAAIANQPKRSQSRESGTPKAGVNYAERVLWRRGNKEDFIIIHRPGGTYRQDQAGGESWEL